MLATLSDSIYLRGPDPLQGVKKRYLVFFITGNPGLIEYYRVFLTHLYSLLNPAEQKEQSVAFDFVGASIPGFDFSNSAPERWKELGLDHAPPFSLDEIIDATENDLWRAVKQTKREKEELGVIVMGHSLGSFITLEVIQRHRRRLENERKEVRIVGGICLFPAVVDIAHSQRGKTLAALSRLPSFQTLIPMLCNLILLLLPTLLINAVVHRIDGLTGHYADATTAFLKSRHGVTQALFMGADEMRQITGDRWDHEVWGAAHPPEHGVPRPRLFFYFGERDHWVADRTRDDLMRLRGRSNGNGEGVEGRGEEWKPKMEIDDKGVPHGFCISHSVPVTEKVKEYIEEIIQADARRE